MNPFPLLRFVLVVALASVMAVAHGEDLARSREALEALQGRLEALQSALTSDEKSQEAATAALRKAGRELSIVGRRLRDTQAQREAVARELQNFRAEQAELDARIARRRERLAAWLRDHYQRGGEARLADFLASRSPNQVARDSVYLQRIGAANLELIRQQRDDIAALAGVEQRIHARSTELAALEARQTRERQALEHAQAGYRRQAAELEARVREQKREVSSLKLDEQRLGNLIAGLERLAEERRRREIEARTSAREGTQEPTVVERGQSSREPVVAMLERQVTSVPKGVAFASLKGRLDAPVAGSLIGRFGEARAGGGAQWKGVFIRAREGAEVRAVAGGEVVFADWLRGFGNLVIIDHGQAYLTIYGNNDVLVAQLGQRVLGGEAIASVGIDGGTRESGLYFEIRHRGEPVDPLQWVRR